MSEKLLGEGTSFEDVEKLRKKLVAYEIRVFDIEEKITEKTEQLATGKEHDYNELRTKQEQLRNLKKDHEKELKNYKKELQDELKKTRHEMNINEQMKEQYGFTNQSKWESEVKLMTHDKETEIPAQIEEKRQEQIQSEDYLEYEINTMEADIKDRYSKLEKKISEHKHRIRLNKIQIHNLRMKLRNRQIFANAILNGFDADMQVAAPAK